MIDATYLTCHSPSCRREEHTLIRSPENDRVVLEGEIGGELAYVCTECGYMEWPRDD